MRHSGTTEQFFIRISLLEERRENGSHLDRLRGLIALLEPMSVKARMDGVVIAGNMKSYVWIVRTQLPQGQLRSQLRNIIGIDDLLAVTPIPDGG